uniref:Glucosylceramidase n=1 Tax=Acrobeloides nanus TaxID=290746 RepID=A0A914CSS0_9BILA
MDFRRFFEEYAKNNITFWGVTMQNEPTTALEDPGHNETRYFEAMFFNSTMERDFAKGMWGPLLRATPTTRNLKLMMMDDNRVNAEEFADTVYGDSEANHYVDGMAVHWYYDGKTAPEVFTQIHEKYPNKFIMYTEACQNPPTFGAWKNANDYMQYIIPILNNWVNAWTDWNMVLDPSGGNGTQIATILVNSTEEFEKQPMFYAQGHLSKWIVPNSVIVGLNINDQKAYSYQNLQAVAALTPNNQKVLVLNNRDNSMSYSVSIVNEQGNWVNLNLEANSFTTIVYN